MSLVCNPCFAGGGEGSRPPVDKPEVSNGSKSNGAGGIRRNEGSGDQKSREAGNEG